MDRSVPEASQAAVTSTGMHPDVVAEMTIAELYGPSETIDPATGRPLTRLDELQLAETAEHGGRLIPRMDGRLSAAAQEINRALHNRTVQRGAAAGALMIAVVAIRAAHKHHEGPKS